MTAIDARARITDKDQARLDALADALTETVMQRLMADPRFIDAVAARLAQDARRGNLEMREALIGLLRVYERTHNLPDSILRRREAA